MNVLCTICARGGSKGVPGKNIRNLLGKPMIVWTIEAAQKTNIFEHIVISTDSDEIADVSKSAGASVFFRRDPEMASDNAAKLPVIRDAFIKSEEYYNERFDILVDLDVTSPLRIPEDITGSIDTLLDKNFDNVITGCYSKRSPYFNLVEEIGDTGKVVISKVSPYPIVRRQDSPRCYDMNGSVYVWRRDSILKTVDLGPNTGIFVMPEERSIDIDTEFDFKIVEFILKERLSNYKN
jgi:CMP-N,N'-diacetyllegionaminic acid synthase